MTATDRTTTPAPSAAELATIARFGIFDAEERVERVARAMCAADGGDYDRGPHRQREDFRRLAAAAVAALGASPAEAAVRRVEDVLNRLPVQGSAGLEHRIRVALAPQADR